MKALFIDIILRIADAEANQAGFNQTGSARFLAATCKAVGVSVRGLLEAKGPALTAIEPQVVSNC